MLASTILNSSFSPISRCLKESQVFCKITSNQIHAWGWLAIKLFRIKTGSVRQRLICSGVKCVHQTQNKNNVLEMLCEDGKQYQFPLWNKICTGMDSMANEPLLQINIECTKLKRKLCKKVFNTFRGKGMESENLRSMGVVESCWLCVLVEGRFNAKK